MAGRLNDKFISTDMLTSQKYLMSVYNSGISECQSDNLRNMLLDMYREEQSAQKKVFDAMHSKGWYQPQAADMNAISQAHSRFTTEEPGARL